MINPKESEHEEINSQIPEILQINHVKRLLCEEIESANESFYQLSTAVLPPNSSIVISPINSIPPPQIIVENKTTRQKHSESFALFGCGVSESELGDQGSFFKTYELKQIGPYKLTKTLGHGSTSKVKLGVHRITGHKIAVKLIPREKMQKKDLDVKRIGENTLTKEARLLREVTLLSLLFHPHIVSLYGYYSNKYYYILFMEYVEGGPLLEYVIKNGKCDEKLARDFFRQLVSAVNYCHSNGIVHRDLKIENILLDKNGKLKLIDFGLSNFYQSSEYAGQSGEPIFGLLTTFCGSLYYAAPELLHGRPYAGPEIDVWSLGVILYVLTVGKVPFDDKRLPVLHEKIKQGNPGYPAHLSDSLASLLKSMICVDSDQRISIKEVISNSWVNNCVEDHLNRHPTLDSYLPNRYPISTLDRNVVNGIVQALGCRYSYKIVHASLEQAIDAWELHRDHPFVCLYYLVKEKLKRWSEFENSLQGRELDMGLSCFGRKYRGDSPAFPESEPLHSPKKLYIRDDPNDENSALRSLTESVGSPQETWLSNLVPNIVELLSKPFRGLGLAGQDPR